MIGNSVKLWLKVVDRSDESLVAWLQAVASAICMHIFQLKQEERRPRAEAERPVLGVVNLLLAGHLWPPPHENMARILQGITDEDRIQKTAVQWDDIQQWVNINMLLAVSAVAGMDSRRHDGQINR